MKKKIAVIVLLLAGSLLFSVNTSAGPVLENILEKGELRIGTSGQQPPMTAKTKNGDLIGMDIEIAQAMAAAMGVKATFVTMPFNELLPALEAGQIDMIISGMTMSAKRNTKVAFVGPYYVSGKGILSIAEKYAALNEATGLNSPEATIAALKDSTSQKFVETLMPKAKLTLVKSYEEAVALLFKNKIDVLVADYPFCALSAYRYSDKMLRAGKSPLTFEPLGIAMAEDALLLNWVENFIALLQGNGGLKKLHDKWLSGGEWVETLP